MLEAQQLSSIEGVQGVWRVDAAYASVVPYSQEHIVQELQPLAALGFQTAIEYHGLTDQVTGRRIFVAWFTSNATHRLPLGTTPEDWAERAVPAAKRRPKTVEGIDVLWQKEPGDRDFGVVVGFVLGLPVYITDLERTLLDILREPELAGGPGAMIATWKRAAERLNAAKIVEYTNQFGIRILRQRVGFLLEALGHSVRGLEAWRTTLLRGGSVKLIASAGYSPHYSERWNLSLNAPTEILRPLDRAK